MKLPTAFCTVVLGFALATSCTRPEEAPQPANLLSKEQMASLLIQFHLLEARTETSRLSPDSARALFLTQKRELLWRRHVALDDSTFERSYRYYAVHNKDMDEIYTIVIDSLQAVERHLGAPTTPPHH